jgi:prepilin-type N-terminal cleavage/methylation domain-containing protein/prepilin-type processing-associated H-X9-DG protein
MRNPTRRGFTLIELLIVVGIIAILIAVLLPTLGKVRRQAVQTQCASNLRQLAIAFNGYLIQSKGMMFWRAPDMSIDGMDWYVHGGRDDGNLNTGQAGIFNRFQPRPLNPQVRNAVEVFKCPADTAETSGWNDGHAQWEEVGTSYNFNASGDPNAPDHNAFINTRGLAGKRVSRVRSSAMTVLFFDACLTRPGFWHGHKGGTPLGNIAFVDGHVSFMPRPVDRSPAVAWLE